MYVIFLPLAGIVNRLPKLTAVFSKNYVPPATKLTPNSHLKSNTHFKFTTVLRAITLNIPPECRS